MTLKLVLYLVYFFDELLSSENKLLIDEFTFLMSQILSKDESALFNDYFDAIEKERLLDHSRVYRGSRYFKQRFDQDFLDYCRSKAK